MVNELPANAQKYGESPLFTEETVSKELLTSHKTKATVWGKVVVRSGALEFVIPGPPRQSQVVEAGDHAIVEPAVEHYVKLTGPATFRIEFYRSG